MNRGLGAYAKGLRQAPAAASPDSCRNARRPSRLNELHFTPLESTRNKFKHGMLELEHIYKSFEGRTVLSDVSLSIPQGATHALIGSSGSGKTTLLRLTLGLIPFDKGYVKINEQAAAVLHTDRVGRPDRLRSAGWRAVSAHQRQTERGAGAGPAQLARGPHRQPDGGAAGARRAGCRHSRAVSRMK